MRRLIVGAVVLLAGSSPSFAADCVRTPQPFLERLMRDGIQKSPTFERLVSDLCRTDVIVYVDRMRRIEGGSEARLLHRITSAAGARYLWVGLSTIHSDDRMIAILAHELQHALEVAREPTVRTGNQIRTLFERIGYRREGLAFDTDAACEIEQRVTSELRSRTRETRASSRKEPG